MGMAGTTSREAGSVSWEDNRNYRILADRITYKVTSEDVAFFLYYNYTISWI